VSYRGERIRNGYSAPGETLWQILREQEAASGSRSGGKDKDNGVPDGEVVVDG
jgi:hypothetical protein